MGAVTPKAQLLRMGEMSRSLPPTPLWTIVDVLTRPGRRVALVTAGLDLLGREELVVTAREAHEAGALLYDLYRHVLLSGRDLPEGPFVLPEGNRRVEVHHRPSSLYSGETAAWIDP
jgi:hypothetical protein